MALSRRKKILFASIPAVGLLTIAIAAEIGLRSFGGRFADDPYLNLAVSKSIFAEEVRDGRRYYRVSHPQAYGWRGVSFPIDKEPATFRVFCLGGSACAGYPHPPEEDFGDYLEFALQAAYPDRHIEVFNVAAHGFASYRVRDVFDDVIEFAPDLIVIWSGNNEFLEKRAYLGTARTFVQRSHLVRFVNIALDRWLHPENSLSAWGFTRDVELSMIVAKIEQQALELRKDERQFEKVTEHFGYSYEHMLRVAAERGVPLAAMTVPMNLRDWSPNVSFHALTAEAERTWRAAYDKGRALELRGEHHNAVRAYSEAVLATPTHAETRFRLARQLWQVGDFARAAELFRNAKELDYNPFRALEVFQDTIRTLAARYPSTLLIDLVAHFAAATQNGVPGFDLFLDYVHPNKRGNLIVARALFDEILARNLVGAPPADSTFRTPTRDYDEYHDLDVLHKLAMLFITMHQYETVVAHAEFALARIDDGTAVLPPDDKRSRDDYRAFFQKAADSHREFVAADRARILGEPHDANYRAALQRSYREYFFADVYKELDARPDAGTKPGSR